MKRPTLTRSGGYDPRLGRHHPANQDPTLPPPSRHFVLIHGPVFDRLTAIACARGIPAAAVLGEILDGWEPTSVDADRARSGEPDVHLHVSVELRDRLKRTAAARGVSIRSLVERALEGVR